MPQSWLKIDRRLHEHWKVRSIAERVQLPTKAIVGCLVYLWGLAEDISPVLGPRFKEADHELPEGLLEAMAEVGWAGQTKRGWQLSTRDRSDRSEEMRALADRRWGAARNADASPRNATRSATRNASRNAGAMRAHQREREIYIAPHAPHAAAASPPTSPEASSSTPPEASSSTPLTGGEERAAYLAKIRRELA